MENAAEAYVAYRKQIEHEDDLIGLRIGWFIAAEALLFAAYGVVLAAPSFALGGTVPIDRRVFTIVPILGIVMAVLVAAGVSAAMHQIVVLREQYDVKLSSPPDLYPALRSTRAISGLGHLPAIILPALMTISWGWLWQSWFGVNHDPKQQRVMAENGSTAVV